MGSFWPKYLMFELINYRRVMCMTLKNDAIFKEKLTDGLKNNIRDLVNFSGNSENLHYERLVFSKAYKLLDEKERKSYVAWHWRVIQRRANYWEISICCVIQQTWSSQWKVLWKCRENIWQSSWMKFILQLICIVYPNPLSPRQTLPSPR